MKAVVLGTKGVIVQTFEWRAFRVVDKCQRYSDLTTIFLGFWPFRNLRVFATAISIGWAVRAALGPEA